MEVPVDPDVSVMLLLDNPCGAAIAVSNILILAECVSGTCDGLAVE